MTDDSDFESVQTGGDEELVEEPKEIEGTQVETRVGKKVILRDEVFEDEEDPCEDLDESGLEELDQLASVRTGDTVQLDPEIVARLAATLDRTREEADPEPTSPKDEPAALKSDPLPVIEDTTPKDLNAGKKRFSITSKEDLQAQLEFPEEIDEEPQDHVLDESAEQDETDEVGIDSASISRRQEHVVISQSTTDESGDEENERVEHTEAIRAPRSIHYTPIIAVLLILIVLGAGIPKLIASWDANRHSSVRLAQTSQSQNNEVEEESDQAVPRSRDPYFEDSSTREPYWGEWPEEPQPEIPAAVEKQIKHDTLSQMQNEMEAVKRERFYQREFARLLAESTALPTEDHDAADAAEQQHENLRLVKKLTPKAEIRESQKRSVKPAATKISNNSEAQTPTPAVPTKLTKSSSQQRTSNTAPTTPKPGWYVQVVALSSQAGAEKQVLNLKSNGLNADVEVAPVKGKTFYRVLVGPYSNRSKAESAQPLIANIKGIATRGYVRQVR